AAQLRRADLPGRAGGGDVVEHLPGAGGLDVAGDPGPGAVDPGRDADLHPRRGPVAARAEDLLHARGAASAAGAGTGERTARAAHGIMSVAPTADPPCSRPSNAKQARRPATA